MTMPVLAVLMSLLVIFDSILSLISAQYGLWPLSQILFGILIVCAIFVFVKERVS